MEVSDIEKSPVDFTIRDASSNDTPLIQFIGTLIKLER
jgi:hypothetical protein